MFTTEIEKFIKTNKYSTFSPKAIFFDMDGVLFDSMGSHAIAWVGALKQMGLPFTEEEAYMNEGRTGASTIDEVFVKQHGRSATEEEKQTIYRLKSKLFDAFKHHEKIPYVTELLKKIQAQELEIYVVTGSGQPSLIDSLESKFPGIFNKNKMVTAFDVKIGKPHPEPYLMALKKSGLCPWEAVVIENAPLGVESASKAGIFTIAVNTGPLNSSILLDSGANLVFDNMNELYEKWETFRKNWYAGTNEKRHQKTN
ncbi:MAG: HAD-IA family hydrolase [Paludibacter sp.]|nr:HAD-IA family hydrolase [Paludibacter sp.]